MCYLKLNFLSKITPIYLNSFAMSIDSFLIQISAVWVCPLFLLSFSEGKEILFNFFNHCQNLLFIGTESHSSTRL